MSIEKQIIDNIEQKLDEYQQGSNTRTYNILIKNESHNLPVINISLNNTYLSPHNHRIKAQLESNKEKKESVNNDPYSDKAQNIIQKILEDTEEFDQLKKELEDLGQKEPGLITREGLLINGNTRCAALKKLKSEGKEDLGIIVAVLPKSINEEDITDLEMQLQMQTLTHQDYTFTNELLFMKNVLDKVKSAELVAKKRQWKRKGKEKVMTHMRILNIIEDIREMSNYQIGYEEFDAKRTHLFDLDKEYQSLKNNRQPLEAERMKNQRVLAMLLGIGKDYVRKIDDDFLEDLLEKRIPEESNVRKYINKFMSGDTEDDILGDSESNIDSESLLKDFLEVTNNFENGKVKEDKTGIFNELLSEISAETLRLVDEDKEKSKKQELQVTLRSIRLQIETIRNKLSERIAMEGFKKGEFKYELDKSRSEIDELKKEFEKIK